MHTSYQYWHLAFLLLFATATGSEQQYFSDTDDLVPHPVPDDPVARAILARALDDGIDFAAFEFSGPALQEIVFWSHFEELPTSLLQNLEGTTKIDVHVHYAPRWYGDIRRDPTEARCPNFMACSRL
ncbi:hypothetical protein B0H14DRAFT_482088 [Mycena olivaceomarginata]|nr:hypothetical protein B0H14DRAFT_482088 [Mycena olivaceomarginata]